MDDKNQTGILLKDRYLLLEPLGRGGEGTVYLCKDLTMGSLWALKLLPADRREEARILRRLTHPCIPRLVDYWEDEDRCCLVMEYIKGMTLQEASAKQDRRNRLFGAYLFRFGEELLQVLSYLHSLSPPVIYGDLKPDNIIIADNGKLYLVDFGSITYGYDKTSRTRKGTPGYAAPEQYEGKVLPASDLYAFGRTMRELCSENGPWVLFLHPGWNLILRRCLREDSARRYKDAAAALRAVRILDNPWSRAVVPVILCIVLMILLRPGNRTQPKADFWETLTGVTDLYQGEFTREDVPEMEEKLWALRREYAQEEEQKKILSLLALNAEYARKPSRAAVYYEEYLLYYPDDSRAYSSYGLFLERCGMETGSRRLWKAYKALLKEGKIRGVSDHEMALWKEKLRKKTSGK